MTGGILDGGSFRTFIPVQVMFYADDVTVTFTHTSTSATKT